MENSKKFKTVGDAFAKIYVKKDIHPFAKKELNHIRTGERDEKKKPENLSQKVIYDNDSRTVSVDGVVIERFKLTIFMADIDKYQSLE